MEAHFLKAADATGLPVMVYDIPGRTGTRVEPTTMRRLAAHPRIVAVKDCAYDLLASARLIAETGLAYYSGCEELNLPLYAVGGAGYVSTVANVAPRRLREVLDAFDAGDTAGAARLHARLLPLAERMMASGLPGTVTVKALLGGPCGSRCCPPTGRRPTGCARSTRRCCDRLGRSRRCRGASRRSCRARGPPRRRLTALPAVR